MMSDTPNSRVAANVRAELGRAGVSQGELASKLSMTASALQRRLSCVVPFSIDETFAVAAALNLPITRILNSPDTAEAVA